MIGKTTKISPHLEIHYRESGSGPITLLMVPGWTMDSRVFSEQLDYFSSRGTARAIAVDPRGHGRSSKTADGNSYEQHGRDLHEFIQALGLVNVVLCGWSFATLGILAYIHYHDIDRLAGLIMLDGPPRAAGDDNTSDWVTYRYDDRDGFRALFTNGPLGERDAFNREFALWMLEYPDEDKIQYVADMSEVMSAAAASELNESALLLDYRKELVSLEGRIPLLYVIREERGAVVRQWAAANTPSATVRAFGKHLMFKERPDEFNAVLAEFLASMTPSMTS